MNTTTSRGLISFVAAPLALAGIAAGALGLSAVAHASVTPGVNTHTSGMVLSKEYVAQQEQEHAKAPTSLQQQTQREEQQTDGPAKQERAELKGDLKAEQQTEAALQTVESHENDQPKQPKAHVYTLKTPIHETMGLMHAGWSQAAR